MLRCKTDATLEAALVRDAETAAARPEFFTIFHFLLQAFVQGCPGLCLE